MIDIFGNTRGTFRTWMFPATILLLAGGFMVDALSPLGVADWVVYLALVALSSRFGFDRFTYVLAAICTVLVIWGFALSPPGFVPQWALVNRFVAITAIWTTAIVFRRQRCYEEAFKAGEVFSSALLDTVGALVVVLDLEGRIVRFNRTCEMTTGYTAAEVAGRALWEFLLAPEETEAVSAVFCRIKAGDFSNSFENHWVKKDGDRRLIQWRNTALTDADGNVQHIIGTGIDVTDVRRASEEREKLEAQIRHAQKLESLGVLAGGIAHDFNNMLTSILGNADLALHDLPDESPVKPLLEDIDKVAQRAGELCKQMLAYSGKGRFVVKPLDLSELVREIGRMLEASISKKAELRLHLAEALPPVLADASQIRQVVMNLIINASEAIGERGGLISVSTSLVQCDRFYLLQAQFPDDLPEGEYVCLEVADTGCGMDQATLDRIFDPFFTTKFTGRGLGLAAVMGIVRGHKGAIKPYSEPGKGTTFKVLFPVSGVSETVQPPKVTDLRLWRGSGTVLLVDDEASIRALGGRMLERLGFSVLTASDGDEALKVCRENRGTVRCVLLDLTMPRMDGEETFRELRRTDGDLPVILCTGYDEQETVKRFAGAGLAGFIQKPYRIANVRETLKSVMGG